MKKTDPRDTVYTSDAEDLRRRYLLDRIMTGEEKTSSPVYSSGHGINIDENNVIRIITADGISEGETLPPSSADVHDAFMQTNETVDQLEVNLATVRVDLEDHTDETNTKFSQINNEISSVRTDFDDHCDETNAKFLQVNNEISSIRADFDDFSEEVNSELSGVSDILASFGAQKVLWDDRDGAMYMLTSQTATLSESVSSQNTGIVLVWSAYESGAKNWNWFYQFVPKHHITSHGGTGINTGLIATETYGTVGSKYVYVHDDKITGNDHNRESGSKSGITYNNAYWALRYVLGV